MAGLKQTLRIVVEQGGTLSREEARGLIRQMLAPASEEESPSDIEIAALLTAMAVRGETADELTGVAEAMRSLAVPLPLMEEERARLVDTCGTGGDGLGTFNISTGAALVAVAAGAHIAKHGNRAVTSQCGSADVLEALGIPVTLEPEAAVACLRATGFMFLYAPALHPTMKRVQPVRRALGFRTIFNLAGPLTNPAGAPAQVMGVFSESKLMLAADAMARLGIEFGLVAHGRNGMDEIALSVTDAVMVSGGDGHPSVARVRYSPEMFGMKRAALRELAGGSTAKENAEILERIFAGERGAKRNIVVVNAAAALLVGQVAETLDECVQRAVEAIDSGAVRAKLAQLREFKETFGREA
ncbi:MAG TPA: anthranilate phosphoribosyltransferase [Acidobacteriaceae bacterium]|nr:anthranilate phosphoribosyltransferase [Acidobacteriaceae bacterium]